MSFSDEIRKTVDDVHDTADEAKHRTVAGAEQVKRDAAGDEMTTGEKVGSFVNQKKNEAEAAIDHTKRDVRDKT